MSVNAITLASVNGIEPEEIQCSKCTYKKKMKLIDASKVLDALATFTDKEHGNNHFLNGIATAEEIVEQMPEAVVRCRDCKHYTYYNECTCLHWDIDQNNYPYTDEDDFCSHGEKR